ncbi:hypothetical protein [Algibacter sp. R77976]|uniref:hypothetical protein n=1 Tax=Algibacter sp. R77976 TaxID=3093873 RepID=UPI0037C972F8
MKNFKTLSLICLALFMLNLSCNKDDGPTEKEKQGEIAGRENIDVTVTLPEDAKLGLGDTFIYTLGTNANVNAQGKATASIFEGSTELAFLIDSNNEPLLAGFISQDKNEISINSTAEVLLYYAIPTYLQDNQYKDAYIKEIGALEEFTTFSEGLTALFKSNPLMLKNGLYSNLLLEQLESLSKIEIINIESKVNVDKKDARSGISIEDVPENKIQIKNKYSRDGHAFIYKKSTKDLNGQETIINSKVFGTDQADIQFEIARAEHTGQDVKANIRVLSIACQTKRFKETISEAVDLELTNNQSEAKYEVTIIGAGGSNSNREMTNAENEKFEELAKKAFIIDYFLPIVLDVVGRKSEFNKLEGSKNDALYAAVLPYLESNSTVLDLVFNGNYKNAIETFLNDIYSQGSGFGDAFNIMQDIYDVLAGDSPNAYNYNITDEQKDIETKILNILNDVMKKESFDCLNYFLEDASTSESWTVTVEKGKVKLAPKRANVTILANKTQEITAIISQTTLNTGDKLEYEWSTTTTYGGVINDLNGNSGTTFTSNFDKVYFLSNAGESQLSDGDNIEEVSVKVFIVNTSGRFEVGTDTMEVNVKKNNFVIKPNGITINGNTSLNLKLEHNDGETTIPNNQFDYKIIWKTSGNYGGFKANKTLFTAYNTNAIEYLCTDTDVMMGTEDFQAVIYAKPKGSSQDYEIIASADAVVNIDNDPKKKYFVLEDTFYIVRHSDDVCFVSYNPIVTIPSDRNFLTNSFFVKKIKNAKSYSLTVESVIDGDGYEYGSWSWDWNNNSTQYANDSVNATDENGDPIALEGDFELFIYGGGINNCGPRYGEAVARLAATQAIGQLTVTLE